MNTSSNRTLKAITSFSLILTSIALIMIQGNPASGYEISIYRGFSSLIWAILIISSIGSIGVITFQAFSIPRSGLWKVAFMNLILNGFIIVSLHALRGYYLYTGIDQLYHLNVIQSLVHSGNLGESNVYPIAHILIAACSLISNIDPHYLIQYLPSFFSILFLMVIIYLLAKQIMRLEAEILIAAVATYVFFFNSLHSQFYPQSFSVLIFIFAVYVYIKALSANQRKYIILLTVVLLILPLSHPTSALILIPLLLITEIARLYLFRNYLKTQSTHGYYIPIILSAVVFVGWVSFFRLFSEKTVHLKTIFLDSYSNPNLATTVDIADKLSLVEIAQYNIKMYGENMFYLGLTFICILLFLNAIWYKKEIVYQYKYLFLLLVATVACIPLYLFTVLGIGSVTIGRALHLMYPILFTPLFVSFVICHFQKRYSPKGTIVIIIVLFAIVSTLSTFSVYHSPWTYSASWQMTKMDANGVDWFVEKSQSTYPHAIMGIETLKLGRSSPLSKSIITEASSIESQGPLGGAYLLFNKKSRDICDEPDATKATVNPFKSLGFGKYDLLNVKNNKRTLEIYSNGEMNIWLV